VGDWLTRLTMRLKGETFLFLAILLAAVPASVNAQGTPRRAGLVVRFGDGSVVTRCVAFREPSITGMELLTRAGFALRVDTGSSIGAGVCKINSLGCDAGKSCFCQCEGSTCAYWQYFHLVNGAWTYSVLGAGLYQVSDGAVEGWSWGNNLAPPVMSLDQICAGAPVAPAPISTPQATAVPTAAPTFTPRPATPTIAPTTVQVATAVTPAGSPAVLSTTVTPSATFAPAALPALLPASPTVTPTLIPPPQNTGVPSPMVSYAVFGVIVLGLGLWLAIQSRKKAR
jgi:hypothetical protein